MITGTQIKKDPAREVTGPRNYIAKSKPYICYVFGGEAK